MPGVNTQTGVPDKFVKVDDELGVVFGWAVVCKQMDPTTNTLVDYYDLHNDHITEKAATEACMDFMDNSQAAREMHQGGTVGRAVMYPVTSEIAKSLGLETNKTGLILAWKPFDKSVLNKFRDGTYTGFSIGGSYGDHVDTPVEGEADLGKGVEDPSFVKYCGDFGKSNPNAVKNKHRKRVMNRFKIKETSAVDKGAQEGAVAVLLKSAHNTPDEPMEKAQILTVAGDLKHQHSVDLDRYAVRHGGGSTSYNGDTQDDHHSHPWIINPDGSITIGMANGHGHELGDMFFGLMHMQELVKVLGDKDNPFPEKKKGKSGVVGETDDDGESHGKRKPKPKLAPVKKDGHYDFEARDYALVPDANDPASWSLRLAKRPGEDPDRRLVGHAVATLTKRAGKLGGDETTVIRRVRNAWLECNKHKGFRDLPTVLKRVSA